MEDNLINIDNSIFTKTPHIYLNLNTSVEKSLNIKYNTVTENLYVKNFSDFKGLLNTDIILNKKIISDTINVRVINLRGDIGTDKNLNVKNDVSVGNNITIENNSTINNNLIVKNKSILQKDVEVYGNLNLYGKSLNVVSEKTLVGDPLVIFGMNQNVLNTDNSIGGFAINYSIKNNDYYAGLLRHPKTSNFYLYDKIKGNNNEPELTNLNNSTYGNLFVNNLNVEKNIVIKENTSTKILNVTNISN